MTRIHNGAMLACMGGNTTVRVDGASAERLRALAKLTGRSVADLVRTWSYADFDLVLKAHARRAAAESRELEERRREAAAG